MPQVSRLRSNAWLFFSIFFPFFYSLCISLIFSNNNAFFIRKKIFFLRFENSRQFIHCRHTSPYFHVFFFSIRISPRLRKRKRERERERERERARVSFLQFPSCTQIPPTAIGRQEANALFHSLRNFFSPFFFFLLPASADSKPPSLLLPHFLHSRNRGSPRLYYLSKTLRAASECFTFKT